MNPVSPYDQALLFIRRNPGTSGSAGLAKLILSLYNTVCGYSFGECIGALDGQLTKIALDMAKSYADRGETEDLVAAGDVIANQLYPELWEMGMAMHHARQDLRDKWKEDSLKAERDQLREDEASMFTDEAKIIPAAQAKQLLDNENPMHGYIYSDDRNAWLHDKFARETVLEAIDLAGGGVLSSNCPESGRMLAVRVKNRAHYFFTDYDAREAYLDARRAPGA